MKKIHNGKSPRVQIGKPFEEAIKKFLFPRTNEGNLSNKWNVTDWIRYCVAKEISKTNNGKIPKDCKDLLKEFTPDFES